MKKSLFVYLVIVAVAAIAFAREAPPDGKACSKTFTWTSGSSIRPSSALVSYIQAKYNKTLVSYNARGCNVFWGDSAPLTAGIVGAINSKECALCDGSVEITLKNCGGDLPANDDYVVLINGNVVASGRIWSGSATPPKTLVIPLPAAKLKAALCNTHGQPPAIDFFVEDDTTVTSARVTIKY
jgi:hypothetical protein